MIAADSEQLRIDLTDLLALALTHCWCCWYSLVQDPPSCRAALTGPEQCARLAALILKSYCQINSFLYHFVSTSEHARCLSFDQSTLEEHWSYIWTSSWASVVETFSWDKHFSEHKTIWLCFKSYLQSYCEYEIHYHCLTYPPARPLLHGSHTTCREMSKLQPAWLRPEMRDLTRGHDETALTTNLSHSDISSEDHIHC